MGVGRTAGIIVAVVMIASIAVGIGFALSPLYGYSYSENNTTGTSGLTVDIYVDNGEGYELLDTNMVFPAYDDGGYDVHVNGDYAVVVKQGDAYASGYVRLWCDMANDSSWALIERMYVTFDGMQDQGVPIEFDFGVSESNGQITSGVPTDAILINGEVPFDIYVVFKDFGYSVDDSDHTLAAFAGSKFVFAFDGTDPLS